MESNRKNIIIGGASRSGKTTLAIMLKELGYNHYKFDSIKRGIYGNFVERTEDPKVISYPLSQLMKQVLIDNDEDTLGQNQFYVMDSVYLSPSDAFKLQEIPNVVALYLGYLNISLEEKIKEIMEYDDLDRSWTKKLSELEIRQLIETHIIYSQRLKEECATLGINYFDTSYNRDDVLENVYKKVKRNKL